ncbi:MAG: ribbon-helix-helix domain-containing protein [Candidatus Diapherotrites archaeon]|nr:ribbon-helix-helix domain-containing protein [Candidatus Diapherotrites archaeon]
MSESILTVRIEKPLIKVMETDMKEFHYSTKSDFLREAIREKHLKLEEERRKNAAWDKLFSMRGKLKHKGTGTWEEYRQIREELADKKFAEFEKRLQKEANQKQPLQAFAQQ